MNEHATDQHDQLDVSGYFNDLGDAIRIRRPEWMTDQQWRDLDVRFSDKLGEVIENLQPRRAGEDPRCNQFDWCTNAHTGDHSQFHGGDVVDLNETGSWYAYLVRDRGAKTTNVVVCGSVNGQHVETPVPVRAAAMVLAAAATDDYAALLGDLLVAGGDVRTAAAR